MMHMQRSHSAGTKFVGWHRGAVGEDATKTVKLIVKVGHKVKTKILMLVEYSYQVQGRIDSFWQKLNVIVFEMFFPSR